MIPSFFIFAATFVFLLFPVRQSGDYSIKKEKEAVNNNSLSINLRVNSASQGSDTMNQSKDQLETTKTASYELSPENFTDSPLEMESWMQSPKKWNSNTD